MLTEQCPHLFSLPVHHLRVDGNEPTSRALLDDLQIAPVWPRLLVGRWPAAPCVFRDLSPRFQHGLTIAAFPIGGYSWRALRVTPRFELPHQFKGHFFLRFGNDPSNAQPTL